MFVRNRTPHRATLAHGQVGDTLAVATIVVESAFRIGEGGALLPDPAREPAPTDPPDVARYPLWHEVSVTASGTVRGPARPPFVVPISLKIGGEVRRLLAFGDRRWERGLGGGLSPTEARPFESMPLSFERAFGGGYDVAPGPHPVSGLPSPGGKVTYAQNPGGRGLYRDAAAAEGQSLPNIELPDQLVKEWRDRPEPAGFAPCPALTALRFSEDFIRRVSGHRPGAPPPDLTPEVVAGYTPEVAMRVEHHAPGRLIFPDVPPGTAVELTGAGKRPLRFVVPGPPAEVVTASGDRPGSLTGPPLRAALRSLHIDADAEGLVLAHGYTTTYQRGFAPEWLRVLPKRAAG